MISLKEACLKLIIREYGRFHFARKTSNDETLIGNFAILFMHYTTKLLTVLIKKENFKEEYLDYLLNEYLVELHGEWFTCCRYRNSMKDIICHLPKGNKLEIISLSSNCNDEVLQILAERYPNIIEIKVSYSSITDNGLMYLCNRADGEVPYPKLKKVDLGCSNVTDEGVKYIIRNLPSLEVIVYYNLPQILYSLYLENLHNVGKLPSYNLTFLHLYPCVDFSYTNLFKICLVVCPKLKSLECIVTDEEQLNLLNNTSLEKLHLKACRPYTKFDINNFLKISGRNLVFLHISKFALSINNLAACCPKLRFLHVFDIDFLDDPNHSHSAFHFLRKCVLSYVNTYASTTNKAVSFLLSFSPKLEYLMFCKCELSTEIKTHILKCSKSNLLKCIGIIPVTNNIIEVEFIKDLLSSYSYLKTLILNFFNFSQLEEKEISEHAKQLPNTPNIYFE